MGEAIPKPKIIHAVQEYQSDTKLHPSLTAAKLAVMRDIAYVRKQRSKGLSYSYASEEAVLELIRPAMVRHGLTLHPMEVEQIADRTFETKKTGSVMQFVRLKVTYTLAALCDDGRTETEVVTVIGDGSDILDKAGPKAMTMALKYALRQAFIVATGDDPDKYASQTVVQHLDAERLQHRESFLQFQGYIAGAESVERLDNVRRVYLHERDFTDEEKDELEKIRANRVSAIKASAETNRASEIKAAAETKDEKEAEK